MKNGFVVIAHKPEWSTHYCGYTESYPSDLQVFFFQNQQDIIHRLGVITSSIDPNDASSYEFLILPTTVNDDVPEDEIAPEWFSTYSCLQIHTEITSLANQLLEAKRQKLKEEARLKEEKEQKRREEEQKKLYETLKSKFEGGEHHV